jgi:uncharacterized zinc-type alcohol dehydrogenase-like protein
MKKTVLTAAIIIISFNLSYSQNGDAKKAIAGNLPAQQEGHVPAKGFAVNSHDDHFHVHEFTRHAVGDNDVQLEILYAGICHSDIHAARDEQQSIGIKAAYPMVPGHEIAGRVIKVGKNVTKFKVGDYAGVGCMVNSCGECGSCLDGKEQFCENRTVFTYNSTDHYHGDEVTKGGYANNIVLSERFAIKIPEKADISKVAPLLCAGITTYSPIRYAKVKAGDKVAVAGYGGLGHMAVQYLVKAGCDVTVFDITDAKRVDALRMGAKDYFNVTADNYSPRQRNNIFDFIIVTIPYDNYDPLMYARMLKTGGKMAIVGLPSNTSINIALLTFSAAHRDVFGSLIGGIAETQEMLDYSVANNIYPEVEIIKADGTAIDKAFDSVSSGEVKFRYVIDMKTLK